MTLLSVSLVCAGIRWYKRRCQLMAIGLKRGYCVFDPTRPNGIRIIVFERMRSQAFLDQVARDNTAESREEAAE
jgi:hypothetical protein